MFAIMNRRDVLKNTGLALGAATIYPNSVVAASNEIEEEDIPITQHKSFVGSAISSPYYKCIRDRLKQDGFKFRPGAAVSKLVRHKEKNESVVRLTIPGEHKQKNEPKEAEIIAIKDPNEKLNVLGLVTNTTSEGSPWVEQHVSNREIYDDTEKGYTSIIQEESN